MHFWQIHWRFQEYRVSNRCPNIATDIICLTHFCKYFRGSAKSHWRLFRKTTRHLSAPYLKWTVSCLYTRIRQRKKPCDWYMTIVIWIYCKHHPYRYGRLPYWSPKHDWRIVHRLEFVGMFMKWSYVIPKTLKGLRKKWNKNIKNPKHFKILCFQCVRCQFNA